MVIDVVGNFKIFFIVPFSIIKQNLITVFINIVIFETPVGKAIAEPNLSAMSFFIIITVVIVCLFITIACIKINAAGESVSSGQRRLVDFISGIHLNGKSWLQKKRLCCFILIGKRRFRAVTHHSVKRLIGVIIPGAPFIFER